MERVPENRPNPWVSPVVVVLKSDGTVSQNVHGYENGQSRHLESKPFNPYSGGH